MVPGEKLLRSCPKPQKRLQKESGNAEACWLFGSDSVGFSQASIGALVDYSARPQAPSDGGHFQRFCSTDSVANLQSDAVRVAKVLEGPTWSSVEQLWPV